MCIVAEQRSVSLIDDPDIARSPNRATCSLALDLEDEAVGGLVLLNFDHNAIRSLQTGKGSGDIGFDTIGIEVLN